MQNSVKEREGEREGERERGRGGGRERGREGERERGRERERERDQLNNHVSQDSRTLFMTRLPSSLCFKRQARNNLPNCSTG